MNHKDCSLFENLCSTSMICFSVNEAAVAILRLTLLFSLRRNLSNISSLSRSVSSIYKNNIPQVECFNYSSHTFKLGDFILSNLYQERVVVERCKVIGSETEMKGNLALSPNFAKSLASILVCPPIMTSALILFTRSKAALGHYIEATFNFFFICNIFIYIWRSNI